MAQQEEIVLWLDHRWKKAIERHLKNETLQEHLENVLDELCNQLPAHEYERISNVIQSEAAARREIDFVVNSGGKRTYIQSAYAMPTEEKAETEIRPFTLIGDSFPKIVVRRDIGKRWYDDNGILHINLIDFLLDKELI